MCNWRPVVHLVWIAIACLLVQGCVGVAVGHSVTKTIKQPSIGDKPGTLAVSSAAIGSTNITAVWLRDHWGKPATAQLLSPETHDERWTYKFHPILYGIVPCVVVPVPLLLPLGRERVVFLVREGRIVSANVVTEDFSGAGASLLGPEGPFTW